MTITPQREFNKFERNSGGICDVPPYTSIAMTSSAGTY